MTDELESLFTDEEAEALKKAERRKGYKDVRSCILSPPLNPRTGIRCWNPKQIQVIRSIAPYVQFLGGVGSGKSIIGAHATVIVAAHNPHEETMVGAPIAKNITQNIYPYVRQLFRDFQAFNGIKLERRWWKTDKVVELINGHRLTFRTFSDPEALRGPSLSGFWGDEFSSVSDICAVDEDELLDIIFGRMRGGPNTRWLRCLLTTTPKGLHGAVKYWVDRIRLGDPDYEIIAQSTLENTALPASYAKRLGTRYSEKFYAQEVEARILDLSDAYFSDVIHPTQSFIPFSVADNEPLDVSIDWGVVHPVAVFSQELQTKAGVSDVICGSISNRQTNDDLIQSIIERVRASHVPVVRFYPDPADMEALRDLRRQIDDKLPNVECSFHYTKRMFDRAFQFSLQKLHDRFCTMDGRRKILFRNTLDKEPTKNDPCPVVWCFTNYKIDPNTGKAPAKSLHKHIVDAFRYLVINKYLRGMPDEDRIPETHRAQE